MKNKIIEWVIFWFICALGALGVGMIVIVYHEQANKIKELEQHVLQSEKQISEYEAMYEFLDDYIELMDDINRKAIKDGFYYSLDGTKYEVETITNISVGDLIDLIEENQQYKDELDVYEMLIEALVDFYADEYGIEIDENELLEYIEINYPELYYKLINF